jgi:cell division septum initiation protein DivIVA
MTEGEFPFRSFTMRSEGYDRNEVDTYVGDQQNEIVELRRALDTATHASAGDTRLHDPEGAVTRTLAIAQETADRVLHDAQVEADRRRAEADEHATDVIAGADQRATRLLGDMEAQAAEVREQGVAAARSAIQVERDKATAELAQVRRVRDDLRTEAVDLKSSLDRYRSQAREASDALAAAASGPLTSVDLPDFIDDDVALAGISSTTGSASNVLDLDGTETASDDDGGFLRAVDDTDDRSDAVEDNEDDELADVISIDADLSDDADGAFGGTFLAEVRAAADDDDVTLAPENEDSDRFLSELRGIADDAPDDLDSDVADRFFEDD